MNLELPDRTIELTQTDVSQLIDEGRLEDALRLLAEVVVREGELVQAMSAYFRNWIYKHDAGPDVGG